MVVFDLDGTLADDSHRLPLIRDVPRSDVASWQRYWEACALDPPLLPIIWILRAMCPLRRCEIWTGRSAGCRAQTEDWLTEFVFRGNESWHNSSAPGHVPLRMRPKDCFTPNAQLKAQWASSATEEIELAFEDRADVVQMWRARGVPVAAIMARE